MTVRAPRIMRALCMALAIAAAGAGPLGHAAAAPAAGSACIAPPATSPIYAGQQQQVAQTPRGPLGYYRFGHGTPVLLVTGFRATLSEWNATFLAELARHHAVIVFDNRGIGRSIPDATSFTVKDMAQDTDALIVALQLHQPVVLGWSMGGTIVQQLAIDDAPAISRMVLLSTFDPGPTGIPVPAAAMATLSGGAGVTFNDVMAVLFPPAAVRQAERCFAQEEYKPADYQAAISSAVTVGQSALLTAWASDDAAASALRKLRLATLVLSGSEDAVASKRNAQALRRLVANARLRTVDGGGHAMMYQDPVSLARAIASFADR
jgi:pimeloyl-ACP methyl ester carboxylesterase